MGITEQHFRFEGEKKEREGKRWHKANSLLLLFHCGKQKESFLICSLGDLHKTPTIYIYFVCVCMRVSVCVKLSCCQVGFLVLQSSWCL